MNDIRRFGRVDDHLMSSVVGVVYDCPPSKKDDFLNCMSDIDTTNNGTGDLTISNKFSVSSKWNTEFDDEQEQKYSIYEPRASI